MKRSIFVFILTNRKMSTPRNKEAVKKNFLLILGDIIDAKSRSAASH
ncbi:hypothetical protein AALB_3288 [Agarivorans albus MKT 106]|uniref:Uncharacterized protein n=1 Tax=Agarivorans albus MKT 106 TaxID=1331007 RepID=R9PPJ8_AGAAL|nr:hypothetical protein AALB_3288 [Agarivorans albus MKT 106]